MLEPLAKEFAETLEELRVEILGAAATFTPLKSGAAGLEPIATVSRSFYLKRRGSVVLGAEFLELKASERTAADEPNFTPEMSAATVAVEYKGTRYKAEVIDRALNNMRVHVLRLTDKVE